MTNEDQRPLVLLPETTMNRRGLCYLVFGLLCAGAILAVGRIAGAQQSDADSVTMQSDLVASYFTTTVVPTETRL
jgi:hypothetical protein